MKDLLSWQSFLLFASMLAVTYSTRLIGFFALRNRTLSRRAQIVMEAAPGCMLIYVIAPYFVSNKPHELIAIALTVLAASRFHVGYRVDRRRQFWAVGVFDAVVDCVFVIPVTLVFRRPFSFRRPYLVIMSSEIFYKAKSWQTKDSSTASTPSTPACGKTRNRLPNSTSKKAKTMPARATCWIKRQTKTCAYTLSSPSPSLPVAKAASAYMPPQPPKRARLKAKSPARWQPLSP